MTKISLLKEQTEKVKISLQKRNLRQAPIVRVGEALDISGSMQGNYSRGNVAKIVLRTLALANTFDDNGEMDMWAFNTRVHELPTANKDNFDSFVDKEIVRKIGVDGGTRYSPALKAMSEFYFPSTGQAAKKASGGFFNKLFGAKNESGPVVVDGKDMPALAIFLTDGENSSDDLRATEEIFNNTQSKNIYWLLVGVGASYNFKFLEKMGDKYPNVGFINFENLDMSDEELYDGMISQEFVDWVSKA